MTIEAVADRAAVAGARQRLSEASGRVTALFKQVSPALQAARTFTDPDLSPEGLERRRAALQAEAQRIHGEQLDQLQAQVRQDAATVQRWAAGQLPAAPDDAAGLMRLQIAWDQARLQLQAGHKLGDVLARSDALTTLALREWGPSYLQASTPPGTLTAPRAEPDVVGFLRSVDDRLAEVHGGEVADAIAAARDAAAVVAEVEPMASYLDAELRGRASAGDGLRAAIGSQMAAADARRGFDPEESR